MPITVRDQSFPVVCLSTEHAVLRDFEEKPASVQNIPASNIHVIEVFWEHQSVSQLSLYGLLGLQVPEQSSVGVTVMDAKLELWRSAE